VRLTGDNRGMNHDEAREIVYGIEPTSRANDPACLGAYLSTTPGDDLHSDVPIRLIAAVGNGELWVVNSGRDIHAGDFLISSDVLGCAMLDDPSRFPVGYVIARAAENVTWSDRAEASEDANRAKISVLFECFARGSADDGSIASKLTRLELENNELRDRLVELERVLARLASNAADKEE
jgi:hypothetical protein